jgi:hypothetical protein
MEPVLGTLMIMFLEMDSAGAADPLHPAARAVQSPTYFISESFAVSVHVAAQLEL